MGRYIKKTGQTTPVNAVVENTWSGSTVNAPSVAMVQDAVCKDNLLINSDFKSGIINQKGKTTYSTVTQWTYCIDMWMYIGQLSIVVGNNNIKITNISATNYFKQVVKFLESGNYTLYIDIAGISGTVNLDINGTVKTLKSGVNTFVVTPNSSGNIAVQFTFASANATLTLNRLKLEKGLYFTGMPVWNEAVEILKCQRYLFSCHRASGYGFETGDGNVYIYVNIPTPMHKQGTVSVNSTVQVIGDGSYKTLTISSVNVSSQDNNLVILSGVISEAGNINIVKVFEFTNFTLDAYDY